jgi:prolyl-tRNA editing enzyme YbaK/EbsC (Cys-tRNA(Pro) deacylase)
MREFTELNKNSLRVQAYLQKFGLGLVVQELPATTRSADDAASAIGCPVENIVKSLVFKTKSEKPILLLVSGSNQVDLDKVAAHFKEELVKPDGKYVKEVTDFPIGGIPPVAHKEKMNTVIDADLLKKEGLLWAAAGTQNAVFSITPSDLVKIIDNPVILELAQINFAI